MCTATIRNILFGREIPHGHFIMVISVILASLIPTFVLRFDTHAVTKNINNNHCVFYLGLGLFHGAFPGSTWSGD